MRSRLEHALEETIFGSRWLLAPLYIGLVGSLAVVLAKFVQEFLHLVPLTLAASEAEIILAVLALVDMTLVANLILMVVFAGYENFVSKIDVAGHKDRPDWMGKVDVSGLKLRLIASIVAISSIQLLKSFMNVRDVPDREMAWMVGIHVVFVVSGVLLAVMDRIAEKAKH